MTSTDKVKLLPSLTKKYEAQAKTQVKSQIKTLIKEQVKEKMKQLLISNQQTVLAKEPEITSQVTKDVKTEELPKLEQQAKDRVLERLRNELNK